MTISKVLRELLRLLVVGAIGGVTALIVSTVFFSDEESGVNFNAQVQVVDRETEEPLACGELTAFHKNGREVHTFEADEEGLISIRLPDGDYSLNLACPGGGYPVHIVWGEFVVRFGKANFNPTESDLSLFDVVDGRLRFKLLAGEPLQALP